MASYSGGDTLRNFTLAQDALQYQAFARSSVPATATARRRC